MLNYNLNLNASLRNEEKNNEDVRPEIYWNYSYKTISGRTPSLIEYVSSSYATMSINALNSNCIAIALTNNNNFTTDDQSPITASLTGSNWPITGSVTMSLTIAGITYDPLAINQFYSSSFSASADVYNANPSITGSIISSSFLASEFYRFYVSASVTHTYRTLIPTGGLIQWLDATDPASYSGSGSVWYDLSGYNHNMSASFGATFPTWDATDKYFDFNGTSSAVSTYMTASLTAFSMCVWTKLGTLNAPTASSSGGAYSISTGSIVVTQFDSLTFDENRVDKWEIATENNQRDVTSSLAETNTNEFLLIVLTNNSGSIGTKSQKLYRDAVLVGTGSNPDTYPATNKLLIVGNRYYTPTGPEQGYAPEGFYTGSIASVLFYNRELSASEVVDIYNSGF